MEDVIEAFAEANNDLAFDITRHREAFFRLLEYQIDRRSWRSILMVRQVLMYDLPSMGAPVRILCLDRPTDDIAKMSIRVDEIYSCSDGADAESVCNDVVAYITRHFPGRCLNLRDSEAARRSQGTNVYAMFFAPK